MQPDEEVYENDECPDLCSEEHSAPYEPDSYESRRNSGRWHCPTTGQCFYADNGEWQPGDEWSTWVGPADTFFLYPGDYEWTECCGCGEWVSYDGWSVDAFTTEYGDTYCSRECARSCGVGGGEGSYETPKCARCNTRLRVGLLLFDPDTEETYCHDHAKRGALVAA